MPSSSFPPSSILPNQQLGSRELIVMASITTTLLDLPTELHLHIIKFLDYPSSFALSHTNQRFRAILPMEPPETREEKLSFLLAIELWPRYDHLFSCSICLKLRPRNAFTDKQIRAKRRKGAIESDHRFCLDCGCCKKFYQPGQYLRVDGREEVLCAICRERFRYGRYCMYCRMCGPCTSKEPPLPIPLALPPRELQEDRCPRFRDKGLFRDLGKPLGEFQPDDMLMAIKMSDWHSWIHRQPRVV
ncbi:unnamed protein product [Penicillium salamii]|uniref:F-box domain-containing protein n=1 Tax=Penicillium salamii TaxID=1612424 RepID=A0A9W4IZJ1_9EURO|nr:unnamed protein product [Penicillium salamii]